MGRRKYRSRSERVKRIMGFATFGFAAVAMVGMAWFFSHSAPRTGGGIQIPQIGVPDVIFNRAIEERAAAGAERARQQQQSQQPDATTAP